MKDNIFYPYIYLDPRKPGRWEFKDWVFLFQPLYIGYGKYDRMEQHMKPHRLADLSAKSNKLNSILAAGLEPIRFKLYEEMLETSAKSEEKDFVAYFGRKSEGDGILTNINPGGGAGIFKKGNPIRNATKGRYTRRSQRINKFDLNKNFIGTYDSLTDAGASIEGGSKKAKSTKIDNCCKGKQKTAYGFLWEFEGTRPYVKSGKTHKCTREVFKYGFDGNFIEVFPTLESGAKSVGEHHRGSSISSCCKGQCRQALGYLWFYEYQGETVAPYVAPKKSYPNTIKLLFPDGKIHQFCSQKAIQEKYNLMPASINRFMSGKIVTSIDKLGWKIPTQEQIDTLPIIVEEF